MGYIISGVCFCTWDSKKSTQDSGVSIEAETTCRSSAKDTSQIVQKISYYGVIRDIILLDYHTFRVPLFDCQWANITNGVKVEDGFTLVNLHEGHSQFEKDPYILASQAKQVFYSKENDMSSWYVVLKAPPRGFQDPEMYESFVAPNVINDVSIFHSSYDVNEDDECVRKDCEGTFV